MEAQVTFSNPHHVIIIWINKHLHTNPLQQNKSHAVRLSHHVHYLRRYHKMCVCRCVCVHVGSVAKSMRWGTHVKEGGMVSPMSARCK